MIHLPLLFTLGIISCIFIIPVHCHMLNFVSYVPYNDIIFSQSTQGIHFTRICTKITLYSLKLFCAFFFCQSLITKPTHHVHFMFTVFLKTHVFVPCIPIGCTQRLLHSVKTFTIWPQNLANIAKGKEQGRQIITFNLWLAKILADKTTLKKHSSLPSKSEQINNIDIDTST